MVVLLFRICLCTGNYIITIIIILYNKYKYGEYMNIDKTN